MVLNVVRLNTSAYVQSLPCYRVFDYTKTSVLIEVNGRNTYIITKISFIAIGFLKIGQKRGAATVKRLQSLVDKIIAHYRC